MSVVDLRWQMVLGCLGAETPPFSQGALQAFRERFIAHDMDRVLLEKTVALVRAGAMTEGDAKTLLKALRVAIDSRPLSGAGRVEETRATCISVFKLRRSWRSSSTDFRTPRAMAFDRALCASLDGFTLHAATRAGPPSMQPKSCRCPLVEDATTGRGRNSCGKHFPFMFSSVPSARTRMKRVAMVTATHNIRRFLASTDEPLDVPTRSPNRGSPYWQSTVLSRQALGDVA